MARETIERDIDGEIYTFYQLGAIKSHNLLRRIGAILAPVLGALANNSGTSILDNDVDLKAVIEALFDKLTESEGEGIILSLLSQVHHNGVGNLKNKEIVDNHFKGRLPHMYKVVYAAFEEEYSGFFGDGGILASISQKVKGLTLAK